MPPAGGAGWATTAGPPAPDGAGTVDELIVRLRELRAWAGLPYRVVHRGVVRLRAARGAAERPAYDTVYRCFQAGRSRLDMELVVDIAEVLLDQRDAPDQRGALEQWRQACRAVLGQAAATAVVEVTDALPAELPDFTGRRHEVARIAALAVGSLAITVHGMPGVGKTRLAIRAGHQLIRQGRYGALQFAVDLRGYHPDRPPADPAAVLDAILRRLGVPGERVQSMDLTARTATYRGLLAGREVLVLLDNAASADQVRPLLPDTPGCLALVTSRHSLGDLPGVAPLSLDPFTPTEAIELLHKAARHPADGPAAADIAELLGHLPLALALVAARIRASPEWTLADHLDRLRQRRDTMRLDSGVEVAVSLSYTALPEPVRRTFRLLALHPGRELTDHAAAALTGTDLATATAHLRQLAAYHLINPVTPGRYAFHDLIHMYATDRTLDEDPARARRAALGRLLDHYEFTLTRAMDRYSPHDRGQRPPIGDPGTPTPTFDNVPGAAGWLESERANLLALAQLAPRDWPGRAGVLSDLFWNFLYVRAYHSDGIVLHTLALEDARRHRDMAGQGRALLNLGTVHYGLSHNTVAKRHLREAASRARTARDQLTEARALDHLGLAVQALGEYPEAADQHRLAAKLSRLIAHPSVEGAALSNLGLASQRMGKLAEAETALRQALSVTRQTGATIDNAAALNNLGIVLRRLGRPKAALHHFQEALVLARGAGHREGEGIGLVNVGAAYAHLGQHDLAREHQSRALEVAVEAGIPTLERIAHNRLGETAQATGADTEALAHHRTALELATSNDDPYETARAHHGIGNILQRQRRADAARDHWRQAAALFAELQVPELAEVERKLGALDGRRTAHR
jgi:tetratricopeptide (TPR) repeat protein